MDSVQLSYLVTAPAKINLFLNIIAKIGTGYHLLETLAYFSDKLYDIITIEKSDKFILKSDIPDNLIAKMYHELMESNSRYSNQKPQHYKIILQKNIPIAAGLGGGSADAAAVARFLRPYFPNISDPEIQIILSRIGADVTGCYHNKICYIHGIGEIISPINHFPKLSMLLVNPRKLCPTKEIFEKGFKNYSRPILQLPDSFKNAEEVVAFIEKYDNDLTRNACAVVPEIGEILLDLDRSNGCLISRMSGSGATCFGIFENKEQLLKAKFELGKKWLALEA